MQWLRLLPNLKQHVWMDELMSKFRCGNFCAKVMQTHSFQTVFILCKCLLVFAQSRAFFSSKFLGQFIFLEHFQKIMQCVVHNLVQHKI